MQIGIDAVADVVPAGETWARRCERVKAQLFAATEEYDPQVHMVWAEVCEVLPRPWIVPLLGRPPAKGRASLFGKNTVAWRRSAVESSLSHPVFIKARETLADELAHEAGILNNWHSARYDLAIDVLNACRYLDDGALPGGPISDGWETAWDFECASRLHGWITLGNNKPRKGWKLSRFKAALGPACHRGKTYVRYPVQLGASPDSRFSRLVAENDSTRIRL